MGGPSAQNVDASARVDAMQRLLDLCPAGWELVGDRYARSTRRWGATIASSRSPPDVDATTAGGGSTSTLQISSALNIDTRP
jgi:hypothetical protein